MERKKMKKNISISKGEYLKAIENAKTIHDHMFRDRPACASPSRVGSVVYLALAQITGETIDNDDFDWEFYAAIRRDACPDNMEHKIEFVMGWFCGLLNIQIIEEE